MAFDPAEEDVTEVVVRAVVVVHDFEPADLPPLGDVVDPNGLSVLFGPAARAFDSDVQAIFVYGDLEITIDIDGHRWLEGVWRDDVGACRRRGDPPGRRRGYASTRRLTGDHQ